MKLFDTTLTSLQNALDARLVRQNLLAGDLANANTPGYVPRDLDFAKAMKLAESDQAQPGGLAATNPAHLSVSGASAMLTQPGGAVVEGRSLQAGLDGNKVDSDRTLADLAANALQYGADARAASKKLAILKGAITD